MAAFGTSPSPDGRGPTMSRNSDLTVVPPCRESYPTTLHSFNFSNPRRQSNLSQGQSSSQDSPPTTSSNRHTYVSRNGSTPTLCVRDSQDAMGLGSGDRSSAAWTPTAPPQAKGKGGNRSSPPTPSSRKGESESRDFSDVEKGAGPPGGGPPGPGGPPGEPEYRMWSAKFWTVMLSNFVAMFLVALDRTIIATAIPRITDDFGSLGDIGWYGSAYMLTTAASQLLFGRIYKFYDTKWTFLTVIIIFEIGSVICAAAPSSPIFITGRAIAGFGSAGIFTGAMMIMIPMVPLHKRPVFQAIFGMVFGFASVVGPLIGGGFTGEVSWRWCFWVNLPIGGVAFFALLFFLRTPEMKHPPATIKQQFLRLDPLGTFFFLPSIVSLLLALEWGGSKYAWNDARVIALMVVFVVMFLCFVAVQALMPKTATVPGRIIGQRTMLAGAFFMVFLAGAMMLAIYYVPLWFQAVQGADPVKSGIYTIPLVVSIVISSIISGAMTQKLGYYVPSMILCPVIMAVGEGLLSTFTPTTDSAHWIAYQFLTGFGLGFGMQTVNLAVQTVFPKEDVSTGIAISFFSQQLGAAIFISVGQAILNNMLVGRLSSIPGLDGEKIISTGATDLHKAVPERYVGMVVEAYNFACTRIFLFGMGLCILCLLCALCMQWKSIKKGKQGPPGGPGGPGGPPGGKGGPGEKEAKQSSKVPESPA